jgi:hypothetical protein
VCEIFPHLGLQCSVKTFNDTGFGLLVVSGTEVHVVFLEKLLKYSVDKPVAGGFIGSVKIVFLQQRIQVLVDMHRRVIAICMGRSIDRQDGEDFKDAFQVIFKSGRRPIRLQTDKGTEFINRVFQTFLKEHNMHFFTTYNEETKASIAEFFKRTLKTKMWKYFTHRETLTYVDVLSEMVASYDHTVHRTIGIPQIQFLCLSVNVSDAAPI